MEHSREDSQDLCSSVRGRELFLFLLLLNIYRHIRVCILLLSLE